MTPNTHFDAKTLYSLIDLTSLNACDTQETIQAVCQQATSPLGQVAAICVYPQWITLCQQLTPATLPIATVINFPSGNAPLEKSLSDIAAAQQQGAKEIDIVFPYQDFLQGLSQKTLETITAYRQACTSSTLKVILETGELQDPHLITQASLIAIDAGADMIKTSTGKTPIGATPSSVSAMLDAIQQRPNHLVGIKISGGVSDVTTANQYLQQIAERMGIEWIDTQHVRIGSSRLSSALHPEINQ